jgi:hypothetical protein
VGPNIELKESSLHAEPLHRDGMRRSLPGYKGAGYFVNWGTQVTAPCHHKKTPFAPLEHVDGAAWLIELESTQCSLNQLDATECNREKAILCRLVDT